MHPWARVEGATDPRARPLAVATSVACGGGTPVPGNSSLTSPLVAGGFRSRLNLQANPGDRDRFYVVEQGGGSRSCAAGR